MFFQFRVKIGPISGIGLWMVRWIEEEIEERKTGFVSFILLQILYIISKAVSYDLCFFLICFYEASICMYIEEKK